MAQNDYTNAVRSVMGDQADEVLGDPAWPALAAALRRAERAGRDAEETLSEAHQAGYRGEIRSVPALLSWRITNAVREAAATADRGRTTTPPGSSASATTSAAAGRSPSPTDTVPSWRLRPLGTLTDDSLATQADTLRTEGTRAAMLARQASESAVTAMEVARSRRGPAHTAVTTRHAELGDRAAAMNELLELDQQYRRLYESGGFGGQPVDVLRASLAVSQARLAERTWWGLRPAVTGDARTELVGRVAALTDYLDNTAPRLAELDARRIELERAAGPGHSRQAAYDEWQHMDRQLSELLETARCNDIADAERAMQEAERLQAWAADRAERYDEVITEQATRASFTPEQADTEKAERAAATQEAAQTASEVADAFAMSEELREQAEQDYAQALQADATGQGQGLAR